MRFSWESAGTRFLREALSEGSHHCIPTHVDLPRSPRGIKLLQPARKFKSARATHHLQLRLASEAERSIIRRALRSRVTQARATDAHTPHTQTNNTVRWAPPSTTCSSMPPSLTPKTTTVRSRFRNESRLQSSRPRKVLTKSGKLTLLDRGFPPWSGFASTALRPALLSSLRQDAGRLLTTSLSFLGRFIVQ